MSRHEKLSLTLQDRADNYHKETGFPQSLFIGGDGRLVGTWVMGNNYTVKSTYYGGYPHGYLKRMRALFPDASGDNTLHLFSGRVDKTILDGDTVDINVANSPTWVDDAQTLTKVPLHKYRFVFADPPYSVEDCDHYQTTMIKRNTVMDALGRGLKKGAIVVWLDQVLPMYRKVDFDAIGYIGMVKSTNHRFRVISLFQHK
jgi:hypothetical protein